MARPSKVSPDEIEQAALDLVRRRGMDALTARSVADALGISTQPVYSTWGSMDSLKTRVAERAEELIGAFLAQPEPGVPPMLTVGVRTLRLALDEPELFALAAGWMRETVGAQRPASVLDAYRQDPRLRDATDRTLAQLDTQLWVFTLGLATMLAPGGGLTFDQARDHLATAGDALVHHAASIARR